MKPILISEHYVRLDLLSGIKASVLDIGCRGFDFANFFIQRGNNVVCVDCDELETDQDYHRLAISDYNGFTEIIHSDDPQATRLGEKSDDFRNSVECMTIESFSRKQGVYYWDLVKIDVEGSEIEIINSLTKPISKQLSIEFHMHLGQSEQDVYWMVDLLKSLGYRIETHEKTNQHGAGMNYWSSLFIQE